MGLAIWDDNMVLVVSMSEWSNGFVHWRDSGGPEFESYHGPNRELKISVLQLHLRVPNIYSLK